MRALFHRQVSQDIPFLHPSETSVLNRLCKLGSDYNRFTEFIEQHTGHVHQQVSTVNDTCSPLYLFTVNPMSSVLCSSGTSHNPARPEWTSWNLPACFLHGDGFYAAAVQTSAAGPRTGGRAATKYELSEAGRRILLLICVFISVPRGSTSNNITCEL